MLKSIFTSLCMLLVWGSSLAQGQSRQDSLVTLQISNSNVNVSQSLVTIGDVVDRYVGPQYLREKIMGFQFARVPLGESKTIAASRLKLLVKLEYGMNLNIDMPGINQLTIRHVDTSQTTSHLIEGLRHELARQYGIPFESVAIDIPTYEKDRLAKFCQKHSRPSWVIPSQSEFPLGSRALELSSADAKNPHRVSLKIGLIRDVVVAKNIIPQGKEIAAADLETIQRPIFRRNIRLATLEQTIGQTARTNIQQFTPITTTSFVATANRPKYAVTARQMVVAEYSFRGLTIKKKLIAMQNGAVGDTIMLQNPDAQASRNQRVRNRISGRITGNGEVKVR